MINLSTKEKLLLTLLDEAGKIRGSTRLQKEIFLAQKEMSVPFGYGFKIHKFGPFSARIFSDVKNLEKRQLIKRELSAFVTLAGDTVERTDYKLTPKGKRVATNLISNRSKLKEVVRKYNSVTLRELLRHVYRKYIWPDIKQLTLGDFLE